MDKLAMFYNFLDCTVNISDRRFWMATLESLSCGTPIIVNMTEVTGASDGW